MTLEQINDLFVKVQTMSDSEKLSQIIVSLVHKRWSSIPPFIF